MTVLSRRINFVLWATLVAVALVLGCKDHKATNPIPGGGGGGGGTAVVDSLVFTNLLDGSTVDMGTTPLVCCGLYSSVNERAMQVIFYDPPTYAKPGWQILILIDHAVAGATTTLPTVAVAPSRVPAVEMFINGPGNLMSSSAGTSSGTIVVHSFHCTASSIQLDFSVNANMGNELTGGPYMHVKGNFRATFPAHACT